MDIFGEEEKKQVVAAIKEAELNTSGEIRVHIDARCEGDVLDQAAFIFQELDMHKTAERNGVLFYLATLDHKFAILGDAGINAKVPENFWEAIKAEMLTYFKDNNFAKGLSVGVKMAGEQLKTHFPFQRVGDKNELSDEVSFSGSDVR